MLTYYNIYIKNNLLSNDNIIYVNDFFIISKIINEIYINNSTRINIINNDIFFKNYNLQYILFTMDKYLLNIDLLIQINKLKLYFIYIYKNNQIIKHKSPINTINIQSNGVDLCPTYDSNYFNSVIPYTKFLNSCPIGYYSYSFSLYPVDKQPSGHLNFTHIDNCVINITSDMIEPFNLINIVKEYQILKIMGGQASLAFLN
jgi:hypothetical protein